MPTSNEAARQETPKSSGPAEQLRFWRGYLDGAPTVLNVPADHRRPSGPGPRAGVQPFTLSAGLTAGLQELSRPGPATLGTTLTTAFATVLYRYTGQVVCEGVLLTYQELLGQASQLAQYLRGRGVGPGVAVGVCLDRSAEQVVALLAILRAGGVYVPLDPATPAERIRYVVRDTGMPLLLTQAWHLERRGGSGRCPGGPPTSWTATASRSRPAWWGSCTWAASCWPAVT